MQGRIREKELYGFDIEHQFLDTLYETREELKQAEHQEEENGKINWNNFDKAVQETKTQIEKEIKAYTKGKEENIFVYDLQRNLIETFPNAKLCAAHYQVSPSLVNEYIRRDTPYIKRGVWFRREKLEKKTKRHSQPKYVYRITAKLLGIYESPKEVAEKFGLTNDQVTQMAVNKVPNYKRKLLILHNPLKFYNEEKRE